MENKENIIITTTEFIPNKEITEIVGIARGSTVRGRNFGSDILAGLKNLVGGEIKGYTKVQGHAREQAMQRMLEEAKSLDADAVINVRFATSMIAAGSSEILAYGTAVKTN